LKLSIRPRRLLSDLWRRFAPSALICLLLTLWFIASDAISLYASEAVQAASVDPMNYIGGALVMSLFFATALSCLCERYGWRRFIAWIAAIAGAVVGVLLSRMENPGNIATGIILFMLSLCFHGVSRKDRPADRLFSVFCSFSVALTASSLIFFTLNICGSAVFALLAQNASYQAESIFFSVSAFLSFFLIAPWLFLGSLPEETPTFNERIHRAVCLIFLLPYLLFLSILLLYAAKIALTMTMPVGVVNGYALAALTLFVFLHLILPSDEAKFSAWFKCWGGWLLIPIAVVQGIAVHMRISAYGLTPSRIYGIIWTALCLTVVLTAILRRRANWFFLAAGALSLILFCTPLNADNLAILDQEHRLEAALQRNNMINEHGEIIANPSAALEDQELIYSAADYLYRTTARKDSLTEQLQTGIDAIRNPDEAKENPLPLSEAKALLFGFGKPEQVEQEWYSHHYFFTGTAVSNKLDTRGYAHAEWISFSQYPDSAKETWTYDKAETSNLVCEGTMDIPALIACLEASRTNGEPIDLSVPVTFLIDGEEVDLAPLLNGVQLVDGSAALPTDTLLLPSGKLLHIASLRVVNYANEGSDDYIALAAWLLTPEDE